MARMSGRKVRISVSGLQTYGEGEEITADYTAEGQYYEKDGCRYLLYQDKDIESGAATSNTMKIRDGCLELTRRGAVTSHMIFEPGQSHPVDYTMAGGTLELEVHTLELSCLWTDSSGRIRLAYSLSAADGFLSRNQLMIKVSKLSG